MTEQPGTKKTFLHQITQKGHKVFKQKLLSGRCLGCLAPVSGDLPLCDDCKEGLALNHHSCLQCAEPISLLSGQSLSQQWQCGHCQRDAPPFSHTVSPYLYSYPLDRFVSRFKQNRQMIYGRLLGRLMADHLHEHYADKPWQLPDQIVAVPTHRKRRFKRGFNPAALLADEVARKLKRPFNPELCQKITDTQEQHTLSRKERLNNLHGSFRITRRVQDQRIALVDDVMTTGATARVIASMLRDNGASEVCIWTLARTPQPESDL